MTGISSALIRMYPRAWRQRYGVEMAELLATRQLSMRTVADLIAGAIDARLNPQLGAPKAVDVTEGAQKMTNVFRCNPAGVSVQDQWRSAAWMIGGSIVLTLTALGLQWQVGQNSFSEGLLYSAFPASLMLSSECTYLKRYSRPARTVMSISGAVLVILMMWGAVAVGYRI
jgi:hypothetical protein